MKERLTKIQADDIATTELRFKNIVEGMKQ
jgi:hypothetical protein